MNSNGINKKLRGENSDVELSNRKQKNEKEIRNGDTKDNETNKRNTGDNEQVENDNTRDTKQKKRDNIGDNRQEENGVSEMEEKKIGEGKEEKGDTKENDTQQLDEKKYKDEKIEKEGQITLEENELQHKIHLITIIGEIEGHEAVGSQSKATKYELLLPQLAFIEDSQDIDGVMILLNTMGGDVEAGLAIAEMIASLSKPSVSLVLGGSHSIGVPIAVSTDYSFIVETGTMVIHPVRMSGTVIGAPQTFHYFQEVQNRIIHFVCNHCNINKERFEELMMETEVLTKDIGSVLCGKEAVDEGLINETGGISQAIRKLHALIDEQREAKK